MVRPGRPIETMRSPGRRVMVVELPRASMISIR
jgi:hypothetical protein